MKITELNKAQLIQLRNEIVLNSLFIKDYTNTLGIEPQEAYYFFEGYAELLDNLMKEAEDKRDYQEALRDYDTEDNLYCWWLVYHNTNAEA